MINRTKPLTAFPQEIGSEAQIHQNGILVAKVKDCSALPHSPNEMRQNAMVDAEYLVNLHNASLHGEGWHHFRGEDAQPLLSADDWEVEDGNVHIVEDGIPFAPRLNRADLLSMLKELDK